MFYEISSLELQDYEKWKTGFDELMPVLKDNGARCRRIFRDLKDPNYVKVIVVWENLDQANKLAENKEMLSKFQKLGILKVDIHRLEEIENKKF